MSGSDQLVRGIPVPRVQINYSGAVKSSKVRGVRSDGNQVHKVKGIRIIRSTFEI